jgi:hypothetical protein
MWREREVEDSLYKKEEEMLLKEGLLLGKESI